MQTQQKISMRQSVVATRSLWLLLSLSLLGLVGCTQSFSGCTDNVIQKEVRNNVRDEGGVESPAFGDYVKKLKITVVDMTHDTDAEVCGAKVLVKAPTGNQYTVAIALAVVNKPGGGAPEIVLMGRKGFHELNADAEAYAIANQNKFVKPEVVSAIQPNPASPKITETRPRPQDEAKELGSVATAYASAWRGLSESLKQTKGKSEAAFQEEMRQRCDSEADHAAQKNQDPSEAEKGCKAYLMKSRLKEIQSWK